MCTYQTITLTVQGSGKGPRGWFPVTDATVYFDHPAHAQAEHTLKSTCSTRPLGRAHGWPSNSIRCPLVRWPRRSSTPSRSSPAGSWRRRPRSGDPTHGPAALTVCTAGGR
jgi:hypothetical protein